MSTVQDIELAIRRLPPQDLAALRAWFAKFDAENWDRQFEADVNAGRLDDLAGDALRDLESGQCADLCSIGLHHGSDRGPQKREAADGHWSARPTQGGNRRTSRLCPIFSIDT